MRTQSRTFVEAYSGKQGKTYSVYDVWNYNTFEQHYEVLEDGMLIFETEVRANIDEFMKLQLARKIEG